MAVVDPVVIEAYAAGYTAGLADSRATLDTEILQRAWTAHETAHHGAADGPFEETCLADIKERYDGLVTRSDA